MSAFDPPQERAAAPTVGELADRDRRIGAVGIDVALTFLALLGPPAVGSFVLTFEQVAAPGGPSASLMLVGILAAGLLQIVQWVLLARLGQTVGKRLLGVRVVAADGSEAGFGRVVALRAWLFGLIASVPVLGALAALVDVAMLLSGDRRCLHDHLAGTKVVHASGGWW